MRWAAVVAAAAAIGLCGASTSPEQVEKAPEGEQHPVNPEVAASPKAQSPRVANAPQPSTLSSATRGGDNVGIELGSWPDWAIVVFTAVLAWLAWRQHVLERRLAADTSDSLEVARRSADAAKQAAEAAERSVQVAADTATKQLRPYVYIFGERVHPYAILGNPDRIGMAVADTAPVTFSIKNFGQTPAKRVRLRARAFTGDYWTEGGLIDLEDAPLLHRADLPPGFDREIKGYTVGGLAKLFASIQLGEKSIFFEGVIEYEDAIGTKYQTNFRRACTGRDAGEGIFFIPSEGNEAT